MFRTALSMTILLLVYRIACHKPIGINLREIKKAWSASKGSRKGGGCHEANDRRCGNGCALSGLFYSCTDQGFGCDRCAVVPA